MGNIVTVKSPILLPLYERKCANYDDSFIRSQFQLATEKKALYLEASRCLHVLPKAG